MKPSFKRLEKAYKEAKILEFNDSSKFIFFSDCHRGDNSFADDFAKNKNIFIHALKHYYKNGFTYFELGDGDELWENLNFKHVFEAHKGVYLLLKCFYEENRLHMIWGNHDMSYKDPDKVSKNLGSYYDPATGKQETLMPNLTFYEAIMLKHKTTNQELFLTHGHQSDWWNYVCWKWSRFLVRALWKPLNLMGIADPTSPARNHVNLLKVERRIKNWIVANNNRLTIVGHTHRPHFPSPGNIAFFNDGSCVHPRCITGLEIEDGKISLIKWEIATRDDGTLHVVRVLLEGPRPLIDYKTST